ncbi:hypothetical protein [Pelistega suis]|uniref:DUF945 domain-containing protein n=1 Tax=Pelistega suis TaxID=1631957 RepID=A0A849P7T1_9BURK|nr:hypothetical protein [Pelistega suis]NOL51598.1 hypothetical protein [Pelistega suis]
MSKKLVGTLAAVAVVGAGVWFGGNYYLTQKVEEEAKAFITKNNLTDQIQWAKAEGRINKTATFYDVVISPKKMKEKIFVKELHVNDFSDKQGNYVLDLSFKGLSDNQGKTLLTKDLAKASWAKHIDTQSLPLMDGQLAVRQKDDSLAFTMVAEQGNVGDVSFSIDLAQTDVVINTLKEKGVSQNNPFQLLGLLSQVTLEDAYLQIKDKGLIQGRDKTADANLEKQCLDDLMARQVSQAQTYCASLNKFINGEAKTLNIAVKPTQAISLFALFNQLQRSSKRPDGVAALLETLKLEVKN